MCCSILCGQKCCRSCDIITGTPEMFAASEDCVCVSRKQKPTMTCSVWISPLRDPLFLLGASGKDKTTRTNLSSGSLHFAEMAFVRASIDVPFKTRSTLGTRTAALILTETVCNLFFVVIVCTSQKRTERRRVLKYDRAQFHILLVCVFFVLHSHMFRGSATSSSTHSRFQTSQLSATYVGI